MEGGSGQQQAAQGQGSRALQPVAGLELLHQVLHTPVDVSVKLEKGEVAAAGGAGKLRCRCPAPWPLTALGRLASLGHVGMPWHAWQGRSCHRRGRRRLHRHRRKAALHTIQTLPPAASFHCSGWQQR